MNYDDLIAQYLAEQERMGSTPLQPMAGLADTGPTVSAPSGWPAMPPQDTDWEQKVLSDQKRMGQQPPGQSGAAMAALAAQLPSGFAGVGRMIDRLRGYNPNAVRLVPRGIASDVRAKMDVKPAGNQIDQFLQALPESSATPPQQSPLALYLQAIGRQRGM